MSHHANPSSSAFDSALQKTSNLISNYILSPSKHSLLEDKPAEPVPTISQRIEQILSNFDKLSHLQVTPMNLDIIEKRELNLDAVRKILTREAYFIDEEKKWIKE